MLSLSPIGSGATRAFGQRAANIMTATCPQQNPLMVANFVDSISPHTISCTLSIEGFGLGPCQQCCILSHASVCSNPKLLNVTGWGCGSCCCSTAVLGIDRCDTHWCKIGVALTHWVCLAGATLSVKNPNSYCQVVVVLTFLGWISCALLLLLCAATCEG